MNFADATFVKQQYQAFWLLVAIIAATAFAGMASGADIDQASCRVGVDYRECLKTHCRTVTNWASGTLIAPGRVLTCSHEFDGVPQRTRVYVVFAGQEFDAKVIKRDRVADLVLLAVPDPITVNSRAVEPTGWNNYFDDAKPFSLAGFGSGKYVRATGKFTRWMDPRKGLQSFALTPAGVPGDSGGGVFDSNGLLVGVRWGAVDGETYASGGQPLVDFLWPAN